MTKCDDLGYLCINVNYWSIAFPFCPLDWCGIILEAEMLDVHSGSIPVLFFDAIPVALFWHSSWSMWSSTLEWGLLGVRTYEYRIISSGFA